MAASKKTVDQVLDIIENYLPREKIVEMLEVLNVNTTGNASYIATINMLLKAAENRYRQASRVVSSQAASSQGSRVSPSRSRA